MTHTKGLHDGSRQALDILNKQFGYGAFRGQQEAIISKLIDGQDAVVLMPTGGGKSLCYQIPALVREGVGIVISPLIALMQDQVAALQQLGIHAAFLNSSQSYSQQQDIEQQLRQGTVQLLYIAPERLNQPKTLALLQQINIALFAIDEAHCVSQWGHDFRADYLQLHSLHENFPHVPRIALTATADERTRAEIIQRLNLQKAEQYIAGFDRPNIQYRIQQKQNPRQQLLSFIRREHPDDTGIIYCLSRKKVEATASWLNAQGFDALPYHAGLPQELRAFNQSRFLRDDGVIIVATIAFGMGIDKPNVRFVAHLDLPKGIESYYQETGRAGRDGEKSTAWMVYGLEDVIKLRQMLENSQAAEEHKRIERHRLESMLGFCEITSCRRHALLLYFGENPKTQCGNCDSCLNPVETWNGTVVAQKALSCAYRTGQRFGVNHLIDVLCGADTAKIRQFNHQELSTYGIGQELSAIQWKSVFRQLVSRGLFSVDMAGYGSLHLTEQSRPLLRGDTEVFLRKDAAEQDIKPLRKTKSPIAENEKALWQTLRDCRKQLAEEFSVPPYAVFHDKTLIEMMRAQPVTQAQMMKISGVGEHKFERFGEAFIAIFEALDDEKNDPKQEKQQQAQRVLNQFNAGVSIPSIASQFSVSEHRVYSILAEFIECGVLPLNKVVQINGSQLALIEEALLACGDIEKDPFDYKACNALLGEAVSSSILCCIRAALLASSG